MNTQPLSDTETTTTTTSTPARRILAPSDALGQQPATSLSTLSSKPSLTGYTGEAAARN
jgi:hypothetical protein